MDLVLTVKQVYDIIVSTNSTCCGLVSYNKTTELNRVLNRPILNIIALCVLYPFLL